MCVCWIDSIPSKLATMEADGFSLSYTKEWGWTAKLYHLEWIVGDGETAIIAADNMFRKYNLWLIDNGETNRP